MRRITKAWNRAAMLVAAASMAAACGPGGERCVGDCPNVAGVYTLQTSNVSGQCGFAPLLPGPSIELKQSEDGSQVTATLIDPVNQLEVQLAGDLLVAPDRRDRATFSMVARFPRQASMMNPAVIDLSLTLVGNVLLTDAGRVLTVTLTNTSFLPQQGGGAAVATGAGVGATGGGTTAGGAAPPLTGGGAAVTTDFTGAGAGAGGTGTIGGGFGGAGGQTTGTAGGTAGFNTNTNRQAGIGAATAGAGGGLDFCSVNVGFTARAAAQ
ncbi:MAG: hypothetical protein ACK4N5_22550 [Myxococcales bacterium]